MRRRQLKRHSLKIKETHPLGKGPQSRKGPLLTDTEDSGDGL